MYDEVDAADDIVALLRHRTRNAGSRGWRVEQDWLIEACGSQEIAFDVLRELGMRREPSPIWTVGDGDETLARWNYVPAVADEIKKIVAQIDEG
jgi:hypothetical protein